MTPFLVGGQPADTAVCTGPTCGARIVWSTTHAGKSMPVDTAPAASGNCLLYRDGSDRVMVQVIKATTTTPAQPGLFDAGPRYLAHWATCPDAEAFRTRKVSR